MDLLSYLSFGTKIIEALACITGFLCWARLYPRFWRAFPVYLLVITCCEFAGWYMNSHGIKGSRAMYSFFVVPLQFLFIYFLYFKNLPKQFHKTVLIFSLTYILSILFEYSYFQYSKLNWLSLSYSIGCILMLALGIIYFLQLFKSEKLLAYKKQLFFWVNLGLMLFYVGTLPFYAAMGTIYTEAPNLYAVLFWMSKILIYIMYGLFITGFLCSSNNQK